MSDNPYQYIQDGIDTAITGNTITDNDARGFDLTFGGGICSHSSTVKINENISARFYEAQTWRS